MGLFKSTKNFVTKGWNMKGWAQVDNIKKEHTFIKSMFADFISKSSQKNKSKKTYQEIVNEKKYSDADVSRLRAKAMKYFYIYCGIAVIVLGYVAYLFSQGAIVAGLCSIPMIFVPIACAFKEHFFVFCLDKKSFKQNFATWSQNLICRDEDI